MKKIFLSFADSRMANSLKRIKKQAHGIGVYDEVMICNELDLDQQFRAAMSSYLQPAIRGFGYWSWKPAIILQALQKMNDGDVLQYTDAGCHLNKNGISRLMDYFDMAQNSPCGILAFQGIPPQGLLEYDGRDLLPLEEYKWTKGDLLDFFKVRGNEEIIYTPTITAGVIFIKKCEKSVSIINEWKSVFLKDFSLADDSPSAAPNLPGFIEHRHDQAIFSIICKTSKASTVSCYEYWYPKVNKLKPDWDALKYFPIHARRDKDLGFFRNATNFVRKVVIKLKRLANYRTNL